jgi:hypothetical protein
MEEIREFLITKIGEVHIVNNIFQLYYEDWEERQYNKIREELYILNNSLAKLSLDGRTTGRKFFEKEITKKEKELAILKYKMMQKYDELAKTL